MNNIQKQFHSLKRITPDAQKKATFRHALESRVHADMRIHAAHASMAGSTRISIVRSLFHAPSFALAIVIAILGSSGGVAFASQGALPGTTLYGVKLKTEQARLTFTRNEKRKAELHIEFASRRMHEIEQLITNDTQDDAMVTEIVAHYEHELSEGESLFKKDPSAAHTATALFVATESHKDTITALKEKIAARTHGKLHDDLDEAYEHAESHSDTALLTALATTATSSETTALSEAVIETSRKKVRSLEKNIKEKKRAIENAQKELLYDDPAAVEAVKKMEDAEMIADYAKTRFENKEYRESIERSIEARTLMKEASLWNKEHDDREDKKRSDDDHESSERDRD